MSAALKEFVGQRAETLAREFLTRRPDVDLHRFHDRMIDFIVTLRWDGPGKAQGFMPFAVVVKGTERELPTPAAASRYLSTHLSSDRKKAAVPKFFMPAVAVVYSVQRSVGYYAWIAEPTRSEDGKPSLHAAEGVLCVAIEPDSLDDIVGAVVDWYANLADRIAVGV